MISRFRWLPLTCLLVCLVATADERILSYHSDIVVAADATMTVTETIRVQAEGDRIRRGIYRDFPTHYKDRFGNDYVVDFRVLGVTRDGEGEAWHTESRANGVRVYVGSANTLLDPGQYSYTISYRTDRQIGYFADHDELYWNVTGNGWGFSIDRVSAEVQLPGSPRSDELTVEGYTGPAGAQGRDYQAAIENGRAVIETNRVLAAGEGLTLAFGWPKGLVFEPDDWDRAGYLLEDNLGVLMASVAWLGVVGFLLMAWTRHGKDPEAGVTFAHYEPPAGYSPASARYIRKMGYDPKTLTAAVVNLAVKGHLTIANDDDEYFLERQASDEPLAAGEGALFRKLFADGPIIGLDDKNHQLIGTARRAHKKALRRDYYNIYFRNNTHWLVPSFLGSVLVLIAIVGLDAFNPLVAVIFAANLAVQILFLILMKAPTRQGRELMDKLDGFELYLTVAEKDDLNVRHPPDLTPQLFERYLPFAIALGVEHAWADQFTEVFASLNAQSGAAYRPVWYHGNFNTHRLGSFAEDVGSSFSSAISSAATPPGSSSGSGGGGFSGGGGGGGGGGGW